MTHPITYDFPARTFSRVALATICLLLGGVGTLYNLFNNPFNNIGGSVIGLAMLVYGAGLIWGMMHPQQISLTRSELLLPKTIVSGNAKAIPYEDILGVSLILHKWGRTCIIHSVNHKFATNTHVMGHKAMFDMIDQIHAHASHLGPPPVGTLGGLFRAGMGGLPQ